MYIKDFNKFCNLPIKDKEKILKKISNILKINKTRRFLTEKKTLQNFENLMDYLDIKAKNNNLSKNEIESFTLINRLRFINELYIDIDAFNTYFNNYFLKKETFTYDDLNILFQASYIYLMNCFNKPFESIEIQKKSFIYKVYYFHQKMYLEVPRDIITNASSKKISKELFYTLAIKEVFSLCHEFAHTAIYRYIEKDKNEKNNLFREIVVSYFNEYFYNENHNNFYSEMYANEFAVNFTKYLLKNIINDKILDKELLNLSNRFENNKTKITSEDIDNTYNFILKEKGKEKTLKPIISLLEKEK